MTYKLTAPCLFGLESVLKKEIENLGYDIVSVDDGRVSFSGDGDAVSRTNLWLRTAERVLLDVGECKVLTFDELFEAVKAMPWEDYIPKDGKFWVSKATSIRSKLFSATDIQKIVKKAIVERLKEVYNVTWMEESGAEFPIRVFLKKDIASIGIDTSGEALHRRGYRIMTSKAPLSETLAAGLLQLSVWDKRRPFIDPFCGSGTIPIEAAMIGANLAPGLNRGFTSEAYAHLIPAKTWMEAVDEANDLYDAKADLNIQGFDADGRILKVARDNAVNAGVDHFIHFQERMAQKTSSPKHYGVIVTNPPYGERMSDKTQVHKLYQSVGEAFKALEDWSYYIITSYENFEEAFGKKAAKKRKLYNGMLKTVYYSYPGPKPPR